MFSDWKNFDSSHIPRKSALSSSNVFFQKVSLKVNTRITFEGSWRKFWVHFEVRLIYVYERQKEKVVYIGMEWLKYIIKLFSIKKTSWTVFCVDFSRFVLFLEK